MTFVAGFCVCRSDVLLRLPFSPVTQSRPANQSGKFRKQVNLESKTFYGHKNHVLKVHTFQSIPNGNWNIQCRISSMSDTDNAPYVRSSNVIRRELVSINARIARIKREQKLLQVSSGVGAFKNMRPDDEMFQKKLAEGLKIAYEIREQLLGEIDSLEVVQADLLALERRIAIIVKEKAEFSKNGLNTSRMDKALKMAEDFKKTLEAELEDARKTGRTSSSRVDNPSFEQQMQGRAPVSKTPVAKTPTPKSPVPGPDGRFEGELTDEEIAEALKEMESDADSKAQSI
eukprot:CAMPEP_0196661048 /NCGR_PEP_ID=MMETSP1086-20130531/42422_1 /TAXON_ID=77921 /ORGANISM="Cyanoptyche  gloeocystis , Strain SAG4.97" /LENGTH=286 /DNA_ID=CAMNT_0041995771 /DNA_START=27 /DNA_END=887 /DNA_ORIENTATION=+